MGPSLSKQYIPKLYRVADIYVLIRTSIRFTALGAT